MEPVSVVRLPAQFENVLSEYSSWTGGIPRVVFSLAPALGESRFIENLDKAKAKKWGILRRFDDDWTADLYSRSSLVPLLPAWKNDWSWIHLT